MAIIWSTGFETGTPATIFDSTDWGDGAIQTTIKHTGAKAIYSADDATNEGTHNLASLSAVVGRLYLYFDTLPTAKTLLVDLYQTTSSNYRIYFDSADNKLSFEIENVAKSQALAADTWYRVDFKCVCTGATHTLDGQVAEGEAAGTPIAQVTQTGQAADTITYVKYCKLSGGTGDLYYDDLAISSTAGDYPIGPINTTLTVNADALAHAATAPTLIELRTLAVQADAFTHTSTAPSLNELRTLAVQADAFTHASENVVVTTEGGEPTNTVLQITGEPKIA